MEQGVKNKGVKSPMTGALEEAVTRVARLEGQVESLMAVTKELHARIERLNALGESSATLVQRLKDLMGYDEADEFTPFKKELEDLTAVVEGLREKVEGRNKSAPVKRNMTDADAFAVATGEYKDLGHKEAGEKIGLTYAQVYSFRLEFTFKHVHKQLRESGWKNPWKK